MSSTQRPSGFKSPRKSKWAEAYWEGARRGVITLTRCRACGQINHPPGPVCTGCLANDFEVFDAAGRGEVVTYTVTTRAMHEEFEPDAPYVIAYVRLEEGVTLVTWLRDIEPTPAVIGTRVRVAHEQIDEETWLHRFVPEEAAETVV